MRPLFIPIHANKYGSRLTDLDELILISLIVCCIYFTLYMIVLVVAGKDGYKDLSIVGKIIFAPIGLISYLVKKIF